MASSSNNSSRQNPTDQQDLQSSGHVRWFVLQGTDEAHPVSKLSPFIIDKALKAAAGDLKTVKRLQKGDILPEASSSTQSHCLGHLKDLGGAQFRSPPTGPLTLARVSSVAETLWTVISSKYFRSCTAKE